MAKIFAKKHNYEVDAAQELYSQSASNVFGSFFGCAPIAASLSRSLIQEAVGGVTQITSLISCSLLLLVLLFVGPVFEKLPNCVLSSIIVVALKGMFLQVNDLRKVWAISRADASIWIAAFLGVVIIDIDYGLMIGVLMSLVVLLFRGQKPSTAILGPSPTQTFIWILRSTPQLWKYLQFAYSNLVDHSTLQTVNTSGLRFSP